MKYTINYNNTTNKYFINDENANLKSYVNTYASMINNLYNAFLFRDPHLCKFVYASYKNDDGIYSVKKMCLANTSADGLKIFSIENNNPAIFTGKHDFVVYTTREEAIKAGEEKAKSNVNKQTETVNTPVQNNVSETSNDVKDYTSSVYSTIHPNERYAKYTLTYNKKKAVVLSENNVYKINDNVVDYEAYNNAVEVINNNGSVEDKINSIEDILSSHNYYNSDSYKKKMEINKKLEELAKQQAELEAELKNMK